MSQKRFKNMMWIFIYHIEEKIAKQQNIEHTAMEKWDELLK